MGIFVRRLLRWAPLAVVGIGLIIAFHAPRASALDFFGPVCAGNSSAAACDRGDKIIGNDGIILRATNLIAIIGGIAAVFMVVIAGFLYITAAGDAQKSASARTTLTYALVGIIIITLARTIVIFVVTRV
jgi:hypothetical protein